MQRKPTISDLLALRDGELEDAELAADIFADTESRETLVQLARIKGGLNALPTVAPPPWEAVDPRVHGRSRWLQRFPLATAATVFMAAALSIMLWNPTQPVDESSVAAGPQVTDPVGQLMLRSRRLEAELFTPATASAGFSSSEQALLYGIAEVDAELNALYESGSPDPAERERLWRQRVTLLESLSDIQAGQAVLRPAIY